MLLYCGGFWLVFGICDWLLIWCLRDFFWIKSLFVLVLRLMFLIFSDPNLLFLFTLGFFYFWLAAFPLSDKRTLALSVFAWLYFPGPNFYRVVLVASFLKFTYFFMDIILYYNVFNFLNLHCSKRLLVSVSYHVIIFCYYLKWSYLCSCFKTDIVSLILFGLVFSALPYYNM